MTSYRRTMVYLTPEQLQALRDEAARAGVSLAELMRRVVDEHLHDASRPPDRDAFRALVALGRSGHDDVAERHDHHLAQALEADHPR